MTDEWVAWHRRYDRGGDLLRRLEVVQQRIREALDVARPGPIRAVSLCAGDGRDLLGVLAHHPRARDVRARLVERSPELAARGRRRAAALRLPGVEFVTDDASDTRVLEGAVPADLVLVCGVFGNVTDGDVRSTVRHLPELCAARATVVWTRGRFPPDLTPAIRRWFRASGFSERSFTLVTGTTMSVGTARLATAPRRYRPGVRLFTFLPAAERPSNRSRARRRLGRAPARVSAPRGERARATGIGGVFLRSRDPERLARWYRDRLGVAVEGQVATLTWRSPRAGHRVGHTVWAALADDDRGWGPRRASAMVNYRVRDLEALLPALRREGVNVSPTIEWGFAGKFGWADDPEGNRLELWEPPRRYRPPERPMPME